MKRFDFLISLFAYLSSKGFNKTTKYKLLKALCETKKDPFGKEMLLDIELRSGIDNITSKDIDDCLLEMSLRGIINRTSYYNDEFYITLTTSNYSSLLEGISTEEEKQYISILENLKKDLQ